LLYESAARADEVLSLNVEDIDVANKRAVVISGNKLLSKPPLDIMCL
jgi:integrase